VAEKGGVKSGRLLLLKFSAILQKVGSLERSYLLKRSYVQGLGETKEKVRGGVTEGTQGGYLKKKGRGGGKKYI